MEDLVLSRARVRLPESLEPPADDSEPPTYDICLVHSSSGTVHGSVPLTPTGEEHFYKAARPLKGKRNSELTIEIRGREDTRLFATPPLFAIELLRAANAAAAEARASGDAGAEEMEADAEKLARRTLAGGAGKVNSMELPRYSDVDAPPPDPKKDKGKGKDPKKGGGGAEEEGDPNAAVLWCDWRLQRALPTVGKALPGVATELQMREMREAAFNATPAQRYSREERYRPRPLQLKYSGPKDLVSFETRLNSWRAELSDNLKIPQQAWPPYAAAAALEVNTIPSAAPRSTVRGGLTGFPPKEWREKWRAPPVPWHMRGDPLTLAAHKEYIEKCESHRLDFHRQAISVGLSTLHEELLAGRGGYKTADDGIDMLTTIRAALDEQRDVRAEGLSSSVSVANCQQADVSVLQALLKTLRRIKLPFEMLVPDLDYEEVKASLVRMLLRELDRRKRAERAERAAAEEPKENKPLEHDTVGTPWPPKESGGSLPRRRPKTAAAGSRVGVLTFRGASAPRPESAGVSRVRG